MIASLRGTVQSTGPDHAVIDVGGVGYLVYCAAGTLAWLAAPPAAQADRENPPAVFVHIETHVREDAITLYGFRSPAERAAFRRLQSIQGVGARVSLAILSTLSAPDLARAIALSDSAMVARTPGVGPRLATRIVTELKDKLADFTTEPVTPAADAAPGPATPEAEATSALANLGYRLPEAQRAVAEAAHALGPQATLPALIREALKRASR